MREDRFKRLFGRRLKLLRELAGLTQSQLAERIGVTMQYVSMVERGLSSPSFRVIADMGRALNVDPASLFLFSRHSSIDDTTRDEADPAVLSAIDFPALLGRTAVYELDVATGEGRWSESAPEVFGLKKGADGISTEQLRAVVHPADRKRMDRSWAAAVSGGAPAVEEFRMLRDGGEASDFLVRREYQRDQRGELLQLRAVYTDVSDLKRMAEIMRAGHATLENAVRRRTEDLHQAIQELEQEVVKHRRTEIELARVNDLLTFHLKNSPLCTVELDPELRFLSWSDHCKEVFGWQADEVLGCDLFEVDFVPNSAKQDVRGLVEKFRSGEISSNVFENPVLTKDGAILQFRWFNSVRYGPDGRMASLLCMGQDITPEREAQRRLKATSEQLELLLEHSPVIALRMEGRPPFRATFISQNTLAVTGHAAWRFYDDPDLWKSVVHSDDWDDVQKALAEAARNGSAAVEYRLRHAEGRWLWLRESYKALCNAGGGTAELIGYAIDVTERKAAREALECSEREKAAILENITEHVALYDLEHRIVWHNRRIEGVLGMEWSDVVGKRCWEVWHGRDGPYRDCPVAKTLRDGRPAEREAVLTNGRVALVKSFPVHDEQGRMTGVVEVGTDVTGLIAEHEAIIGQRASSRDITARKRAEMRRRDMERVLRHDLKSPAVTLHSGLRLLGETSLGDTQRTYVREMQHATSRLLGMLELIRQVGRMESGYYALDLHRIGLAELLDEVNAELHGLCDEKSITVVHAIPQGVHVQADRLLLLNLLINLLRNAVEASPDGEQVVVEAASGSNGLTVSIRNTGLVPKPVRKDFFGKFVTHGKNGGLGLGTYSAKLIVDAHNGHIGLSLDEPAGTTTVSFTLPAS